MVMNMLRMVHTTDGWLRRVNVDVVISTAPPPQNRPASEMDWENTLEFLFDTPLPSIRADKFDALSRLLQETKGDGLQISQSFITIRAADKDKYNTFDVLELLCECFGLRLDTVTQTTAEQDAI